MEFFRFLPRCVFPKSMTQSFLQNSIFAARDLSSDSFWRWMRAWSLARMWVSPIGGSCPMKPGRRKGKPGSASLDLPIGSLTHSEKMQVLVLKIYDSPGNHGRHAMGGISQPIQHLKIVFFLTLHAPHPLTLGPKSSSFLPRQWAVDTAKEIYRFIHEKSRLREEVEKHNKVRKVDFFLKCLWCCLAILSL